MVFLSRNLFILPGLKLIMAIGITFFIVAALIIAIWLLIEVKRFKHKIFAIFLICLILFTYLSFSYTLSGQDINLKTIPGLTEAGKLYFVWLGSMFNNLKVVTANVIDMNWKGNVTKT